MAIREVAVAVEAPSVAHRLLRIELTADEQIVAVWAIRDRRGKTREARIAVTQAIADAIRTRPSFQAAIDQIAEDTFPRTGAQAPSTPEEPSP
jgi:hypothetical protein